MAIYTAQPVQTLIDPTTQRAVWSGPNGEGGSAKPIAGGAAYTMPDGRTAYFVPGQNIQNGNRQALGLDTSPTYTSLAPGAQTSAAPDAAQQARDDATQRANASDAADIASLLQTFGLTDLSSYVEDIARGRITKSQLLAQLYNPTTGPGAIVDKMYPELRMLRDAKKEPLSITEIQQLRTQYRQVLKSHDAPPGFYDSTDDFTQYIVGQKSPQELDSDLAEWRLVADDAAAHPDNTTILEQLHRLYNVTPDSGAFLAYVADPTRGLDSIKKMVAAGGGAAAANRSGFGDLNLTEAEQLAAGGITPDQAAQGFGDLVHSQELTRALPGETGSGISRQDQLGAEFGGDANARAAIERVRGQRVAQFQGGGRTAVGQNGQTGLTPI